MCIAVLVLLGTVVRQGEEREGGTGRNCISVG